MPVLACQLPPDSQAATASQFTPPEDRAGAADEADVRVLDDFELLDTELELADLERLDAELALELADVELVDTVAEEAELPAAASAARVTAAEALPLAGS